MALTDAQYVILADHILSNTDQDVVDALAAGNITELTRLYNLDSSFWVWRSDVPPKEYMTALDWTEVDNMSVGKSRVWDWSTQYQTAPLDATNANLRAGIAAAFPANTQAALNAIAKRLASVFEEIFATGTGTNGDPGIADPEGPLSLFDVSKALNEF